MGYDFSKFRVVRHGLEGITANCRHCDFSLDSCMDKNVSQRAKYHAKSKLHTVDVYRENWIEYTSYYKSK